MARHATKKQLRDRELYARWAKIPDAEFARHGLSRERLQAAQAGLQGWIVWPDSKDYDKDRMIFNPAFDPHPAFIVYCVVESDVRIALELAQLLPVAFTVRSGGHCSAGFSAGSGVLIDVSNLNDCTVDEPNMTVTAGCGCPFQKLYGTLEPRGLHVPAGECEDVCVGGYVQGGGYGFTSNTYGMNCDNVIDMRVMLANGGVVDASPSVNSDLFWAMRGGTGGNFGVLLSVRYRLRRLGPVFGWAIIFPLANASDLQNATSALMFLQNKYFWPNDQKAMNLQVSLCYQPGMVPNLPPSPLYPFLMLRGLYVGTQQQGLAAIAPIQALAGAYTQWTKMASFTDLNDELLNKPYSMPAFVGLTSAPCEDKASRYVARNLSAGEWRSLLDYYLTTPNQWSYAYLECYGGAINAAPPDINAFVHRNARFNAVLDVFWFNDKNKEADRKAAEKFLNGWLALLDPMSNGEIYQNYPRLHTPGYASAYWGTAQAGLYAVKCKYDPAMAFRFAQDVKPLMPPGSGPGPVIVLPGFLQKALDQPITYSIPPVAA